MAGLTRRHCGGDIARVVRLMPRTCLPDGPVAAAGNSVAVIGRAGGGPCVTPPRQQQVKVPGEARGMGGGCPVRGPLAHSEARFLDPLHSCLFLPGTPCIPSSLGSLLGHVFSLLLLLPFFQQ